MHGSQPFAHLLENYRLDKDPLGRFNSVPKRNQSTLVPLGHVEKANSQLNRSIVGLYQN